MAKAKRQIYLPTRTAREEVNHDRDSEIERRIKAADEEAKLEPITPEQLPMQPMFWHVLIEPMRPKQQSKGGLILAEETTRVEEILTTIGRLVAIGPAAFQGKTESGIDLSKDIDRDTLVGRWVMYAKHTGQEIKLRSGHRLMLMNDSELLAFVDDPEEFRHWI